MTEPDAPATAPSRTQHLLPWLNLVLTVALVVVGLFFLSERVGLRAIGDVLAQANKGAVLLAVGVMLLTLGLKAWRWQLLFTGSTAKVPYSAAFWASSLSQYVNLIVPFLRLGEVARIYSLNREANVNAAQTIGTLVVEKVLDLIFFGLTIVLVIPYIVLPEGFGQPGSWLLVGSLLALVALYVLAFQTERAARLLERLAKPLPDQFGSWITRVGVAGLEGLSALRNRKLSLVLLVLSLAIAALAVLLPYVLFPALDLRLTIVDAAVMHVVVSAVAAPPSTPVKIGVFNGAAAFVLWQLGIRNEPIIVSYAILFYVVVVLPQLVLGLIASVRSRWSWNVGLDPQTTSAA